MGHADRLIAEHRKMRAALLKIVYVLPRYCVGEQAVSLALEALRQEPGEGFEWEEPTRDDLENDAEIQRRDDAGMHGGMAADEDFRDGGIGR